jgi:hypothetical protein
MDHKEYALCKKLRVIFEAYRVAFTHTPNEQPDPKRASMNKAIGVSPGFPDYSVFGRVVGDRILFIEAKAPGARLSKPQQHWREVLERLGYAYEVVTSTAQLVTVLDYYYGRPEGDWELTEMLREGGDE